MLMRVSAFSDIWKVKRLSVVRWRSIILPSSQSKLVLARSFMRGFRLIRPWLPMTQGTWTAPNSSAMLRSAAVICSDQWRSESSMVVSLVWASSSWMSPEKMSPPSMTTAPS